MEFDDIYVDQAAIGKSPSFGVFCLYLPLGIKRMDAKFGDRIRAFKKGECFKELNWRGQVDHIWNDTRESIANDIERNPHLHKTIKDNLLLNLDN